MIAFLIESLDVRGGTHKQFLKLLDYADARGEEFCIITKRVDFDKTYPEFRRYSSRIRVLEEVTSDSRSVIARCRSTLATRKRLRSLLKDVDVANIHDCGYDCLLPAFKGIPTVWQINDLDPAFRVGVFAQRKDSYGKLARRKIICHGLKYVNGITVNVTKNADNVRHCMHRDAKVLYCGIEPVGIYHSAAESFGRFEHRKVNILSSGVWYPYRNYEVQVEAVKLLVEHGYDVHLSIIGSTQYSPAYVDKIRDMIRAYSLDDRIEICGMVDEERFRELHEQADIFTFVNVDQSWGLAVFEAMSCGLPVVVSESVGATEILHDGVDSVFANPLSPEDVVSKIESLVTDRGLYTRISDTASQFHHAYTWDKAYCAPMLAMLCGYHK